MHRHKKLKSNAKNINIEGVSKNGSDFGMCSNLSNNQCKID